MPDAFFVAVDTAGYGVGCGSLRTKGAAGVSDFNAQADQRGYLELIGSLTAVVGYVQHTRSNPAMRFGLLLGGERTGHAGLVGGCALHSESV